ncbi:Uncharacterised protein [Mycobacterium tuberculosis]|nr:Uncharacterised protein [Mycobacterium tuberculosis]COX97139.1 Uncharacterised protein [Mycobacterium tuberculosis]
MSTAIGGHSARKVPSSGTVTADSPRNSSSNASNSSSARSISSMSSTGGVGPRCRTHRRMGRSTRYASVYRSASDMSEIPLPRASASLMDNSWRW